MGVYSNKKHTSSKLREGLKKKRKKNVEFSTSRYFTPRPVKMWKFILFFFTIFLDVLAHFKHIREKNIFPLEKLKTLRIFTQIWSL